ncbi:MAG: hypothetical protein ACLQNE_23690 [Thermoguttaceae bacterium]
MAAVTGTRDATDVAENIENHALTPEAFSEMGQHTSTGAPHLAGWCKSGQILTFLWLFGPFRGPIFPATAAKIGPISREIHVRGPLGPILAQRVDSLIGRLDQW